MTRPTLTTRVRRALRDTQLSLRGASLAVACSGGPDSTAMLHALALQRARGGFELVAVGVDHGLREAAAEELAVAAKLAEELGVGWRSESLKVASGPNLQARAREARHAALARAAREEGAIAIALGHTADDRAETVVLRILRGAGARGLAVLPLDGPPFLSEGLPLFRPLIAARRAEVVAHLARHRLEAAEDPSNRDRRFARARVRHEVMPLLEELSPRVVDHLCAIAEDLAAPEPREEPSFLADLGRKQREALLRAIDQRRGGTTVRVSGGRDLEVRFLRGTPVVFVPK